uniref:Uncharacterized protein n=1 Tax=Sphaerodactylus townsendi TaxID=933632 RepID=A0ACB8FI52_9SAUR
MWLNLSYVHSFYAFSLCRRVAIEKDELIQNLLTQVIEQLSRVFKINELKTEVANHLAMLEKRVESASKIQGTQGSTPSIQKVKQPVSEDHLFRLCQPSSNTYHNPSQSRPVSRHSPKLGSAGGNQPDHSSKEEELPPTGAAVGESGREKTARW